MSGAAIKTRRNNGKAKVSKPVTKRVAIYTRKSVSEGLDQEFNSLDLQRQAVRSYIDSQVAEAWEALPESYDDGGFTGANTDRPAFKRLIADIEAGLVDVVAVYRLDRLSRSLLDFAQLMKAFEARVVAFVSVTEHFDTSTPMGRMVLNMLATFAQFERETIAQRTSDKMLATRQRGQWTGGRPVLGYDVAEKQLAINEAEAERVREIFRSYVKLRSLISVVNELDARGWRGKQWTTKSGASAGGNPISKSTLITLLRNPVYIGKVKAGDELCAGQHEAIVDQATWDAARAMLIANRNCESPKRRSKQATNGALLQGLVRCACGSALTPHYTATGNKRYLYYVCCRQQKQGATACPGSRVAAGKLEAFVVDQLRAIGRDPELLEATLGADAEQRSSRLAGLKGEASEAAAEQKRLEEERAGLAKIINAGGVSAGALKEGLAEVERQLAEVNARTEQLARELADLEANSVDPVALRKALAEFDPVWAALFPAEKARVLALLIEEIEFDAARNEIQITFRPGGPEALQLGAIGESHE